MKRTATFLMLAGATALAACGGGASGEGEDAAGGDAEAGDPAAIEMAEEQLVARYISEGKELISVELEPTTDGEFGGELRYRQAEGDVYSPAGEYVASCTITPGDTAESASYSCSSSSAD